MGLRVLGGNMVRPDILMLLLLFSLVSSAAASVTYDHRAIMINGQRRILISGSIHYPRSTPEVICNANVVHGFFLFLSLVSADSS
jgi:hypothetical protein